MDREIGLWAFDGFELHRRRSEAFFGDWRSIVEIEPDAEIVDARRLCAIRFDLHFARHRRPRRDIAEDKFSIVDAPKRRFGAPRNAINGFGSQVRRRRANHIRIACRYAIVRFIGRELDAQLWIIGVLPLLPVDAAFFECRNENGIFFVLQRVGRRDELLDHRLAFVCTPRSLEDLFG